MGKKCIPGLICVENMTLFVMVVILIVVLYMYYLNFVKPNSHTTVVQIQQPPYSHPPQFIGTPIDDPYYPPVADVRGPVPLIGRRAIPVNIPTQGYSLEYSQIGILTRMNGIHRDGNIGEMILPLMGRQIMTGRDKWQYYTMSTTGNMNTKLPIRINGKSCTSDIGCDSVSSGDIIYVEGFNDTFRATVYDNAGISYIPF